MDTKLRNASDVVIFADEATSIARKEMMGIFLSCYNKDDQEFVMEYLTLFDVSSTKSAVLLEKLVKILKEPEIDPQKIRFCYLDGANSMLGEIPGLQKRICHISPHSIYVNCRCHRLALCFKHLTDQFSWLAKLDKLLLGLWKSFHYSTLNCSILTKIQKHMVQKHFIWLRLLSQDGYHMVPKARDAQKGRRRFQKLQVNYWQPNLAQKLADTDQIFQN